MTDEDTPDDPFDALDADAYRDRRGDPFESLGDDREDATEPEPEPEPDPERGADPFTYPDEGDGDGRASGDDDGGDRTAVENEDVPSGDPFGDVDRGGESPFESGKSTFDRVDVDAVDPDEVWERMAGGSADAAAAADEEVEVSKHAYCEECEYFSSPPDAHCTHEGTEILEFVDMETVRVVNCPVVAERRELGRE